MSEMLIPAEMVQKAIALDAAGVSKALTDYGYLCKQDMFFDVEFLGMNQESEFVYKCTFADTCSKDGVGEGNVFVFADNDGDGNWVLHADY